MAKKVPKISPIKAAYWCRLITEESEYSSIGPSEIEAMEGLAVAAEHFCASYTGLEIDTDGAAGNEDIELAEKCLVCEWYDNRQMISQYTTCNPTVMAILNMYSCNLLAEADA